MRRITSLETSAEAVGGSPAIRPSILENERIAGGDEGGGGDLFRPLITKLLKDWCDGMLRVQIDDPANPARHGALDCPACDKIHGRCIDAVYPFLHVAHATGEQKYLDAGIAVFEWGTNVSLPDGSWTVIQDPTSWRGVTVFGAIAVAEALKFHGSLLDSATRTRWLDRLGRATEYIYENFDTKFSNINYASTGTYALHLIGEMLDRPNYVARSRALADQVKEFLTEPHKLIYGEGMPTGRKSGRGLRAVDLGYNIEESLNNLVMYALREKDDELLHLLTQSLEGHLEFILPDGGWDNSWGTRQFKWTYWGSRTSDGCQQALGLMAGVNSAFGTAAYRYTRLLQDCTHDGLLYGGLHYRTHDLKPCIHHTFVHAKPLAYLLDHGSEIPSIDGSAPLPRAVADGVKFFPEISVWLAARGPWRATVSSYDWIYRPGVQQATGGALSLLWHDDLGPIMAASMARYMLVETNNQQPNPDGEDIALTPRLEITHDGEWYSNLYDLTAKVEFADADGVIDFHVIAQLQNEDRATLASSSDYEIDYRLDAGGVEIRARSAVGVVPDGPVTLVLPILSPSGERVTQTSSNRIEISKPNGTVVVEANVALVIRKTKRDRAFNMVPGAQAVPIEARLAGNGPQEVICTITVEKSAS